MTKKQKSKKTPRFFLGKEKNLIVSNLTLLLASGMSIPTSLEAIKQEIKSSRLKRLITNIQEEVENGSNLWRALLGARIFNQTTVSLVRVGEESGRLSENLKIVAEQNEKSKKFESKIRSAMMYPVFVMIVAFIIALGISWFILPRLASVFAQLDVKLPVITRALIDFGSFLENKGQLFFPILAIAIIMLSYLLFVNKKTKFIGQSIILVLPGFKKLIQESELARLGYLLGTLLKSGLPIEEALNSIANATSFRRYRKLYLFLKDKIEDGNSFQKSLLAYKKSKKIIPYSIQQMIVAGEQSGTLADILLKIGENFEEKTELTTKNLVVILEPLLLVIVWLGVVGVALAVILPIYSLIGGLSATY